MIDETKMKTKPTYMNLKYVFLGNWLRRHFDNIDGQQYTAISMIVHKNYKHLTSPKLYT